MSRSSFVCAHLLLPSFGRILQSAEKKQEEMTMSQTFQEIASALGKDDLLKLRNYLLFLKTADIPLPDASAPLTDP